VSATAGQAGPEQAGAPAAERSVATRMGLAPGNVVQELGYDDDCDHELRTAIATLTGSELVDEDHDEAVDTVLLWWREDDGDLVDALVDSLTSLTSGGAVWLLTPKVGRDGHVEPEDIGEAAPTAGLSSTSSVAAAKDWSATRLMAPKLHR
jgi:hypothetical protein